MGLASSGLLTQRLTLQEPIRASNEAGGHTTIWSDVGEANGRVYVAINTRRTERIIGDQPKGTEVVELVIDTREETPVSSQRVVAPDGREYDLIQVDYQGEIAFCVGRRV